MRALAERHGPAGHGSLDAHIDTWDTYFGDFKTPMARLSGGPSRKKACSIPDVLVQIGIRGGVYDADDGAWGLEQGIRVITIENTTILARRPSLRRRAGWSVTRPTYVSF